MTCKFSKDNRLLKHFQFKSLFKQKRFVGENVFLYARTGNSNNPKLGITCSKKFGKACLRNRFKRITREAFRKCIHLMPGSLEINILPLRNAKQCKSSDIQKDLERLLKKLS